MISVIIPTFNRSDKLSVTIQNIVNQSYKNIELIIVDDGSDDNTAQIIKNLIIIFIISSIIRI